MRRTTRLKKPQVPEIEDLYRFDDLGGRPKYGGVEMTHETDIPTYETIMEEVDGKIAVEADARSDEDAALQENIDGEVLARQGADAVLQSQIDAVVASSDVKDIVGTYAALEAYDTSTLGDNDIIKVLQDETHQDETTYYRWVLADEEFSLIGEEGPYYTKAATDALLNGKADKATTYTKTETDAALALKADKATTYTKTETDTLLGGKQDTLTAGANIQINNNTISATDTTYSDFTGTDGTTAGTAGLVPAPATTDAGKFLKADGTWGSAGGGGGAEFIELTTADYNWNSSTGSTGTPDCVALWLLPSGIYKGPADSSIEVRATRGQEYSMGAGYPCYVIVKECENTDTNRAIVTYVDAGNGNVVEYCNIDENGRNYTVKNFPNVVQTTGTSTTNVMSQKAVTDTLFNSSRKLRVQIGDSAATLSDYAISIGPLAYTDNLDQISLGRNAGFGTSGQGTLCIGRDAKVTGAGGIALGVKSQATVQGEMNIGSVGDTSYGYNNTNYRLLTGVHDPVNAHDAATKGYVDGLVGNIAAALNAINNGGGN